jgi:hypothetical protein
MFNPAPLKHDAGVELDLGMSMPKAPRDFAMSALVDLMSGASGDVAQPIHDLAMVTDMSGVVRGAIYQVSSALTGQLMSVHGSATADQSIVEQQPAKGTADQRWTLMAATTAGAYQIVNEASGICLDVQGASKSQNTPVLIASCNNSLSQSWTLKAAGNGFFNIVNGNSGDYVDINGASTSVGAAIIQYPSNGNDNQKWFFTRIY